MNFGSWGFRVGQMSKKAAKIGWQLGGDLPDHQAQTGHTHTCAGGEGCSCGDGCGCG